MNKLFFSVVALAALMLSSCSEDGSMDEAINGAASGEVVDGPSSPTVTFTATIEGDENSTQKRTRTTVDIVGGQGTVKWATGDAISIANSNNAFDTFTLSEGANSVTGNFVGNFADGTTQGGIAVYPAGAHTYDGTTLTVNLPAYYGDLNEPYTPNTNVLMMAEITGDDATLYFRHLGGVVYFTASVPVGTSCVTLTAKGINGNFVVDMNSENPVITQAADATDRTVIHRFKAFETETTETFYFPVPVGEYQKFVITFAGVDGSATKTLNFDAAKTLARTTIAMMPSLSGLKLEREWVDLGLPNGTLWAKTNVGAVLDIDDGDYYAWGEITPKSNYSWANYKWWGSGTTNNDVKFTKYVPETYADARGYEGKYDDKTQLELTDETAHMNWGGEWRMPTYDEMMEIVNYDVSSEQINVEVQEVKDYNGTGVAGSLVIGKNGNSIFFPASGWYGSVLTRGIGYYWTSELNLTGGTSVRGAWAIATRGSDISGRGASRYAGHSVRPVRSAITE